MIGAPLPPPGATQLDGLSEPEHLSRVWGIFGAAVVETAAKITRHGPTPAT